MSEIAIKAHEIARSEQVFTDPKTYKGFELTNDGRRIVGCIDPRAPLSDDLPIIVQTAGGAGGKGFDRALALTAAGGNEEIASIQEGLNYDAVLQRATVATAHTRCRFLGGLASVRAEIANPSDFTKYSVATLLSRYSLGDSIDKQLQQIAEAADRSAEIIDDVEADHLLTEIDALHPDQPNVVDMKGENMAAFYVWNHHPYLGLDRRQVHQGEKPLVAQAYHDSVRASVDSLRGTVGMPGEVMGLSLAALISRIAATRTVLNPEKSGMKYLNVVTTSRGSVQVEEEHV